jgi:hypothetical protein
MTHGSQILEAGPKIMIDKGDIRQRDATGRRSGALGFSLQVERAMRRDVEAARERVRDNAGEKGGPPTAL